MDDDTLFGMTPTPLNTDLAPMQRWNAWAGGAANSEPDPTFSKKIPYEQTQDPVGQLNDVNAYVNQVPYVKDGDQWKPPDVFMQNGGECASYALTKYHNLQQLGWSPEDMRVVVLHSKDYGTHAVLAVKHDGKNMILDNMSPDIREDKDVEGYRPIYSISHAGWQYYKDAPTN